MMTEDMELVRQFAREGSEEAFAVLVSRHVNLVFSVSMRHVRELHLAEEITQTVFIILARKASSLGSRTILPGWLCRTARYVSTRALSQQYRRHQREKEAFVQSQKSDTDTEAEAWTQIEPVLEGAMGQLSERDHNAIILRYFEGRNFKEVSAALGTTEAGAKMRVNRALEKLRKLLAKRGLVLSAAVIAGAVSAHSVQAAPSGLASSVAVLAVQGAAASHSTSVLLTTTLKFMAWTKFKITGVVVILVLVAGTATVTIHHTRARAGSFPLAFAGYATPEATVQSLVWAGSVGDFQRVLDACTAEQAERFRNKMAGKSADEIRQAAMTWARAVTGCRITRRDAVSADEVHLHLSAPPSPEGLRSGSVVVVMRKIGNEWKQAEDL